MPVLTDDRVITPDEFLMLEDAKHAELINGRLVEKNQVGAKANAVTSVLIVLVGGFILRHKLGHIFSETTYTCFSGKIRRPDWSFIRFSRLPPSALPDGHLDIPPDLIVEVISPNDLAYEINEKVVDYLKGGVKEVWFVDPIHRMISIRKRDGAPVELDEHGILKSDDLLPGFALKVAEIFQ